MQFLLSDLATQLGGRLVGPDVTVTGVSTDSRKVSDGQLFVPLVAERDGHDFIDGARKGGAGGYVSSRDNQGGSSIQVADTSLALTEIGRIARRRLTSQVVGVTGSVGKTSVKDMIRSACADSLTAHANIGSFNNEIGLPLTLANAPSNAEVTVTEMGARGIGHIAHLCEIAQPTVGVVTAVALAHSELFGTIESVAQAKGELVESLPANGTAILNADDPLVRAMAARTDASVLTFGLMGDVKPVDVIFDEVRRPRFRVQTPDQHAEVSLTVSGEHMVFNACAAIATAISVGVPLEAAVTGLQQLQMSPWRMEIGTNQHGLLVINDSYNANPTSMRAALDTLYGLEVPNKIAAIGVMGELGDEGAAEHLNIAAEAQANGVEVLAINAEEYGSNVTHVGSIDDAVAKIGDAGADTAVLIKGSRSVGLERLAAKLLADVDGSD